MRILVIEDKKKIGEYVKKGLSENGFNVDVADEGNTGAQLACGENYDLVIMDVMLPYRDGWSILKEMRSVGKETPVLFLTALDRVEDRVKGLELGGDDYLVKPFAFSELLARVRSLLRRGAVRQPDKITVEDLEIDLHGAKPSVRKNCWVSRRKNFHCSPF